MRGMNAILGHPRSRLYGSPEGDLIELSSAPPLVEAAESLEERVQEETQGSL